MNTETRTPTHRELQEGGMVVDHRMGDTWNDGGHWNVWIYEMGERFWKVHQTTDYRPDVEIEEVFRQEYIAVKYTNQKPILNATTI